jgi:NhaP-type Na+/H+ or K+/H+ antiporter
VLSLIVCGLAVILLWTFAAKRLAAWHVSGPLVLVAAGVVAGIMYGDAVGEHLDTDLAERVVELILAVLLFVDAIEVHGGFLAGERRTAARLLFLALPLMLVAGFLLGLPLLDVSSWAVVLAISCMVMPVDFAPAAEVLRDHRLPRSVRHLLAVESGYNDGLFSPVFVFALVMLDASGETKDPATALGDALPQAAWAVLVGLAVGAVTGIAVRRALNAGWTNVSAVGIAVMLVPFVTYAASVGIGGNGFVAAFVAGIAYRRGRTGRHGTRRDDVHDVPHSELAAVDSVGVIASLVMWFVFGAVTVIVFGLGLEVRWILYGVLALTVARLVPVLLSLIRSGTSRRDRLLLGVIGPRGTSSIVLGLLAFNAMKDADAAVVLYVMTVVIVGSLVLHGLAVSIGIRRFAARQPAPEGAD